MSLSWALSGGAGLMTFDPKTTLPTAGDWMRSDLYGGSGT
jgi:hypothetical protein